MKDKLWNNVILFIILFLIFFLGEKYIGQIGTYEKALSWSQVINKIPFYIFLSLVVIVIKNIKLKRNK